VSSSPRKPLFSSKALDGLAMSMLPEHSVQARHVTSCKPKRSKRHEALRHAISSINDDAAIVVSELR
jgi:hypothetical protein